MSQRTTPRHGDQIVNVVTGETGRIVDVHPKREPAPAFSVLPDEGRRACVVWLAEHVRWTPTERSPSWRT